MGGYSRLGWLVGLGTGAVCLAAVLVQLHRVEDGLAGAGTRALAREFGSDVVIGGSVEARILPRPHLVLTDVHVHDPDGGSDLDVPRLEATQSLGSLLAGRVSFSQLRLDEPTASIDADRLAGTLRRPGATLLARALPGRIVVTSGVIAIRSNQPSARGLLTGFNGVLEGIDRNGSAVFNGHGAWRGQHLDVSARLEPFVDFMLGRETAGSLKLRMPTLTASVEGQLHAGIRGGFAGEVAVATPSLAGFLAGSGLPPSLGRVVDRVSFSGSGVANADNITFSNARLTLDDTPFEGSLAWQPNEDHGAWTGTFATDTLDLTHALALLPEVRDGSAHWSDAAWTLDRSTLGDIDLRVSSNKARIGPVTIEDAAFSALCREGRIEASLSEARSLDGLIRGRAVATLEPHAVDLKLDVSLSQMDLEPLFAAAGQGSVTGTASGHFTGQARGVSAKTLMQSLTGHGQVSVRQGSLPALTSVDDPASASGVARLWRRDQAASRFDLVTADLNIRGDHVAIDHGRIVGSELPKAFTGGASLLDRSFSLVATDGVPPAGTAPVDLAGTWNPVLRVTRATAAAGLSRGEGANP